METIDLHFDPSNYTIEEITAETAAGRRRIRYRYYAHIPYVSNPVDTDYQSLNICVPIEIDSVPQQEQDVPVLLIIGVGGYMSSRNRGHSGGPAGPDRNGGPDHHDGPDRKPGGPGSKAAGGGFLGLGGENGSGDTKALALAYGYVVVEPGCRGRDNQFSNGHFYGKAPAAIVDLKAAVRYLRYNEGVIPGNMNAIYSTGGSAGGALSCLLAASGNAPEYVPYLQAIGAANTSDHIFGSASYSPITDLEHADGAYEWEYGNVPCLGNDGGPMGHIPAGLVDQTHSKALSAEFEAYLDSLGLSGINGFGSVNHHNYQSYILHEFLIPAANECWADSSAAQQEKYLKDNPWFSVKDGICRFTFEDFVAHCGRMKSVPAFDDFEKRMAEPDLFGTETTKSRHFTLYSLRHDPTETDTVLSKELQHMIHLMNPMDFIRNQNSDCAQHWWIRHGSCDKDTSLPIVVNLVTALENAGKHVNARLIWDGGHCADDDTEGFMRFVQENS